MIWVINALNSLTLSDQTPAEGQIHVPTDELFDWSRIEDFQT